MLIIDLALFLLCFNIIIATEIEIEDFSLLVGDAIEPVLNGEKYPSVERSTKDLVRSANCKLK